MMDLFRCAQVQYVRKPFRERKCLLLTVATVFPGFPGPYSFATVNSDSQKSANPVSEDVKAVIALISANNERVVNLTMKWGKDRDRLRSELHSNQKQVLGDLVALAQKYLETTGGVAVLYWACVLPYKDAGSQKEASLFAQ